MGANSKIEWTHHTFNPWIGCTKVSEGCKFCYAEMLMDNRLGQAKWGPKGTRKVTSDANWAKPLQWDRDAQAEGVRKRVFCASLADVFEGPETMPESEFEMVELARARLWSLIDRTPHLDWLILTKRPENVMMFKPVSWWPRFPSNVWLGTSVENKEAADQRIPHLLRCPAAVRFLSVEPMLGPVDIRPYTSDWERPHLEAYLHGGIDWVIAGGESGPNARPMNPDWARSLRDQCVEAGVPFHFKQWGNHVPVDDPRGLRVGDLHYWDGSKFILGADVVREVHMHNVGKKAAGRLLDGRTWDEFPEVSI